MEGDRISGRSAHDDHIEHAAVAADKAFTRRHLVKPAKPRSVCGRFGRGNTVLTHEGLEQLARRRRFLFVAHGRFRWKCWPALARQSPERQTTMEHPRCKSPRAPRAAPPSRAWISWPEYFGLVQISSSSSALPL